MIPIPAKMNSIMPNIRWQSLIFTPTKSGVLLYSIRMTKSHQSQDLLPNSIGRYILHPKTQKQGISGTSVSNQTSLIISPVNRCANTNASVVTPLRVSSLVELNMPTNNLSSLKWNEEGELSPQDIWNLVTKLTKAEDASKASNLLHLSSKHTHARHKKKDKA